MRLQWRSRSKAFDLSHSLLLSFQHEEKWSENRSKVLNALVSFVHLFRIFNPFRLFISGNFLEIKHSPPFIEFSGNLCIDHFIYQINWQLMESFSGWMVKHDKSWCDGLDEYFIQNQVESSPYKFRSYFKILLINCNGFTNFAFFIDRVATQVYFNGVLLFCS